MKVLKTVDENRTFAKAHTILRFQNNRMKRSSWKRRQTGYVGGLEIRIAFYFSVAILEARNQWGKYVKILKKRDFSPAFSETSVKCYEDIFQNVRCPKFASHAPSLRKQLEAVLSHTNE